MPLGARLRSRQPSRAERRADCAAGMYVASENRRDAGGGHLPGEGLTAPPRCAAIVLLLLIRRSGVQHSPIGWSSPATKPMSSVKGDVQLSSQGLPAVLRASCAPGARAQRRMRCGEGVYYRRHTHRGAHWAPNGRRRARRQCNRTAHGVVSFWQARTRAPLQWSPFVPRRAASAAN